MMADYLCESCGLHFDQYVKREPPEEWPCECGATAKRTFDPALTMRRPINLNAQSFDPVVVHRDAEGNIRFPGHTHAPVPPGFQKVELRTVREVRALEREMNHRESARALDHITREEMAFSADRADRRSDLTASMRHMSPFGRDFARVAMQQMDERRRTSRRTGEAGFYVECLTQDSSNRGGQRDASTDWKYRKR